MGAACRGWPPGTFCFHLDSLMFGLLGNQTNSIKRAFGGHLRPRLCWWLETAIVLQWSPGSSEEVRSTWKRSRAPHLHPGMVWPVCFLFPGLFLTWSKERFLGNWPGHQLWHAAESLLSLQSPYRWDSQQSRTYIIICSAPRAHSKLAVCVFLYLFCLSV